MDAGCPLWIAGESTSFTFSPNPSSTGPATDPNPKKACGTIPAPTGPAVCCAFGVSRLAAVGATGAAAGAATGAGAGAAAVPGGAAAGEEGTTSMG